MSSKLGVPGMDHRNEKSGAQRGSQSRMLFAFALVALTSLAAVMRLHQLDRPSFWGDELRTIRACAWPIPEGETKTRVISQVATAAGLWASGVDLRQLHPEEPWTWRALGVNEWNARIGSCIVGILTIPILVLAGRRMLGSSTALVAGALLALAPWHILWSQAARFYTLQFLLYTLCLIWYFRWRQDRTARLLVATVVGLLLAFLAQPTSIIALAVIGVDLVIGVARREIAFARRELVLLGGGAVVCLGLLAFFVTGNPDIWARFIAFTSEYRYQYPTALVAGTVYMIQLPLAALAGLTAVWLYQRDRRLTTFLLVAAFVPLAAMAVWSLWNFVGLRYVLITLWWWLALASIGLVAVYRALVEYHGRTLALAPAAAALVALLIPLYGYYEDGYGYRGRWREAFDFAMENRLPTEGIATTRNQLHVARYYTGIEDVREMHWTLEEMESSTEFQEITWLVFHGETSVRGTAQKWAREGAELREVFDLRVPQPIEMVRVYRFIPGLAEARRRGASALEVSARVESDWERER